MLSENYYNENPKFHALTSYEEELLEHYNDYLQTGEPSLSMHNRHILNLEEEFLSEDMDSEYDENDWEEEEDIDPDDIDDDFREDYDENDREPDTFSDDGYKID